MLNILWIYPPTVKTITNNNNYNEKNVCENEFRKTLNRINASRMLLEKWPLRFAPFLNSIELLLLLLLVSWSQAWFNAYAREWEIVIFIDRLSKLWIDENWNNSHSKQATILNIYKMHYTNQCLSRNMCGCCLHVTILLLWWFSFVSKL